jgi:hypothetical protein
LGKKSGKKSTVEEYNNMAKSHCGLPARSNATVQLITNEEYSLNYDRAYGKISRSTYYKKLRELKERGKIHRRR